MRSPARNEAQRARSRISARPQAATANTKSIFARSELATPNVERAAREVDERYLNLIKLLPPLLLLLLTSRPPISARAKPTGSLRPHPAREPSRADYYHREGPKVSRRRRRRAALFG